MSTKTIGVVGRGSGWQKVGIELGSCVFYPNSSQPGMFQTFASKVYYFVKLQLWPKGLLQGSSSSQYNGLSSHSQGAN